MSELHGEHIVTTGPVLDGVLEESTVGDEKYSPLSKNSPLSSEEYSSLTLPNLQANDSFSLRQTSLSTASLQDVLDIANARSTYKAGPGEPSVTSSEARDHYVVFHNNQRKADLQKNHSQMSTFSREDSCVSSINMSDFGDKHNNYIRGELQKNHSQKSTFSREDSGLSSIYMMSENSEKSKASIDSAQNSSTTGMSNMSPIVLRNHDDLQLEATKELYERGSSCSESSSIQEDQHSDAQQVTPEKQGEVDEWKDYLRRMSKDRQGGDDEGSGSGSGTESDEESDNDDDDQPNTTISSSLQPEEEEVPGYFLYVTEEGHKIWILLDPEGRSRTDYNDDVVKSLLQSGGEERKEDSYSAFHLSKEDAMTNVTQVSEFLNKQKYEKALVSQKEEQQKKLQLMRQHSTTATTDEDGNEVEGMTIAERKKLLWNSSGKLEATNRV